MVIIRLLAIMTKLEKRAIQITELNEELAEAKKIIERLIWQCDDTVEGHQRFNQRAARFAGCQVPKYDDTQSEPERVSG